jgi:WD40 repeat protein
LDQTIKLWDLFLGRQVGTLKPKHISGVRSLEYTPEYSGTIVSVAHENYIKVWSAEVSIEQAFVGTLEGHNNPVVSAKFLHKLPYVISVDERTTVRIWDIRSLVCLQSISHERKKFDCNGLCVINEQKFLIYGRKMMLFGTRSSKSEGTSVKLIGEAYPIKVEFNAYSKTFMVTTK